MASHSTCPRCGYVMSGVKNYNKYILEFSNSYSKTTKDLIKLVHRKIISAIPSEDIQSLYFFMLRLNHAEVKEAIISHSIKLYLDNQYYLQIKGYNYLLAIIMNNHNNFDKIKESESRRLGSIPPYAEGD